jgi:excisionase family DNA binding protein
LRDTASSASLQGMNMNREPDATRLLTVSEACERLQVSRPTLYGLIRRGELRTITIGRSRRIPLSALNRFVEHALDETDLADERAL